MCLTYFHTAEVSEWLTNCNFSSETFSLFHFPCQVCWVNRHTPSKYTLARELEPQSKSDPITTWLGAKESFTIDQVKKVQCFLTFTAEPWGAFPIWFRGPWGEFVQRNYRPSSRLTHLMDNLAPGVTFGPNAKRQIHLTCTFWSSMRTGRKLEIQMIPFKWTLQKSGAPAKFHQPSELPLH